ncbi:PREDICTED: uncharacterized protein LOC107540768 [Miniopterus natalensis]|uniref:uncharacterized protein LOC107540768 n=1 Tax=Miniopterus natalensis TaxID=291302 RepID=UPI0007A6FEAD|nr:PREDICTED: uncharacterized protein LOC107540768 [Miniopterus natalensis]
MGLAQLNPQALDNMGLAQASPQALENTDLAQVSLQELGNMGLAQVSPLAMANMDLAQVSHLALDNMGLAQVNPQALDNMGLAQASPQALENTGLAQVSLQELDNMGLAQVSPLAMANMDLAQVSHLALDNMGLAQVNPQALDNMGLAQASPQALENTGLAQVSPQELDNMGLAQVSPLAMANMDLAQVSHLALDNMGLAQVNPQALDNMGLAQASPQALENMGLAQVSLQELDNMGLAQVSPLAMANMDLAQVSHLALDNMGLAQVNPQALDNMGLAQASPQALENTDLAQVSLQELGNMGLAQVSPLAMANMDLAQVSHLALDNMGLAQVNPQVLDNMGLAQASPQALENTDLAQVSPQELGNMGLAQVSRQALDNTDPAQVSPLAVANMDLAQVSHLALDNMGLAQVSPQALENMGLAQVSLQGLDNMGLAQVSPLAMANMDLAQVSHLALDNMGLAQVSPQALDNMGLAQASPQALENMELVQVNLQALASMGLAQANRVQHIIDLEKGDLVTVSPVAVNGIQEAHRDTQGPVMARLDLNMDSGDPLVKGVRELLMDSQETPRNMGRQAMGNPHSQDLAKVEEGDLVTVSPVAVNGIREAHRDTQGPVMARLDLNMDSGDPLVKGVRELLMDSQETPRNMGRQAMGNPHSQDLAKVEEGDLVTVSPVAVNGIREAHRDTQGPVMARLDLNMDSGDPLVKGVRELLMDSQETPRNMGRQAMGNPHSQDLAKVEEGDLVTVSPVAVNGIREAHRDTQGPVMARLDLNMDSGDPLVKGVRELLMDSQETPRNMGRQAMGNPHSQDLAKVEEGDLVTVSPVAVNGIREAHRDTQGPVMARLDLNMDSGDPLVKGVRELLMDSQETPRNMGRQAMGNPHSQDLAKVEEGDLVTVSPVAVNGIREAHRDTQGPVMARLDLNMDSGDPLVKGVRELLMDSQETPRNMGRQAMGNPHSQDLAKVEEGDLVTVSPVAVNGIREAHRDTQGPVMARLDLNMDSGDPLVKGVRELLMDSQETPRNMGRQAMGNPHSQDLAKVEEGDLVTVSPVAVNGIREAHRDTQGPVMARLDLNMDSGDPLVKGVRELLMDSQETPRNMGRQAMGNPHSQDLAKVEEGDLVTVSPVAVNGIREAHRDTQGPVMARLDLNMDSGDPPVKGGVKGQHKETVK